MLAVFDVVKPHVGRITLNDPDKLNAMGTAMAVDFEAALQAARRARPRVIVVCGAGRAFSAGGDLALLDDRRRQSLSENRAFMLGYYQTFLAIRDLNVPLVAALHGHAVGAGACLACACDLRVAAADSKMAFSFTRLGLHPGLGITWFLSRLVGPARANELLLTGRSVSADEAHRIGLVNDIGDFGRALALAQQIADNGPLATEMLLATLRSDLPTLQQALQAEATSQSVNYQTEEFAAGLQAIRQRRAPGFAKPGAEPTSPA